MAPRRPAELYRAPFPLYTVRLHPRRALAITAGGGGAAKTGIRNGVHFLQLEQIGGQLSASLLHSHDTETRATMTMALADDIIAAGQDADCHILRFSLQAPEARRGSDGRNGSGEKGPRRRKGPSPMGQGDTQSQSSEVTVESLHSVRTDFSPDALQKAVRFNADCSLLVTGGADGFLRLWEFPSMKKTLEFKAHDGEIEDIALGPDNKVVTAGRDFQCCVWQQDQLVTGLRWNENLPGIPDKAYRYQACRFGAVEDNAGALRLYTVQVPHKRERRPPPCYLTKWDGKSFLPLLTRPCGTEVVSCLSIRYPGGDGCGDGGPHHPPLTVLPPQRLGHLPGAGHGDGLRRHPHRLLAAEAVLREGGARHRGDGRGLRPREPARARAAGGERGRPAQRGRRQPLQAAPAAQPTLPSRLAAAAAALRWAHRGRHPAAAARLPWLPLAPQPPPARTDPPGLPLPCLGPPQQTVKQTRDQPGHGRGADCGGWEPLGGAQPEGTVLAAVWGWPQGGGRPAGPLPHGDH